MQIAESEKIKQETNIMVNEEFVRDAFKRLKEEDTVNRYECAKQFGQPVYAGNSVQIVHVETGKFLSVSHGFSGDFHGFSDDPQQVDNFFHLSADIYEYIYIYILIIRVLLTAASGGDTHFTIGHENIINVIN